MTSPSPERFLVSEHLKGFSAVELTAREALPHLVAFLSQFGPTKTASLASLPDAMRYLFPVKSFPTRYLILGLGQWSLLLEDLRDASSYVEAYALSRATKCRGLGIIFRETEREIQLFEEGVQIREIQSCSDGDRWYYREAGPLQPFEELVQTNFRRKKDRLSAAAVRKYFESYTGLQVPDWKKLIVTEIFGIERSTKDLEVPLIEFSTIHDAC